MVDSRLNSDRPTPAEDDVDLNQDSGLMRRDLASAAKDDEPYNLSNAAEIVVCSRERAEEFECGVPWVCISITSKGEERPELSKENRVDVLELTFDDADSETLGATLFSYHDAADILDFVEANRSEVRVWMVHCQEGISRSSAVAAAVARYLGVDMDQFLGGDYDPNQRVLNIMWERISRISDE